MYLLKCSGSWVGGYNGKNSFPEVFRKKGVLKNLAKFTVKHLPQSLLFNKVAEAYFKNTCFREQLQETASIFLIEI